MIVGTSLVALVALVNGFAVARNIPRADEIDKAPEDSVSTRCLTHRDPASTDADLETRWSTHHQCTKTSTDTTTCTSTPSAVVKALTTTSTITLRALMAISVATVTTTTTSTSRGSTTITQTSTYTATATSTYTSTVPTRSGFVPIQSTCPDSGYDAGTSNSEIAKRDEEASMSELQHAPEGSLNRTSNSTGDSAIQAHLVKEDDIDDGLSSPKATSDIKEVDPDKDKIRALESQLHYLYSYLRFLQSRQEADTRLIPIIIHDDSQPPGLATIPMDVLYKLKEVFKSRPIITEGTLSSTSTNNSTTKSLRPRKLPQDHLHLQHGVLCEEWPPRGKCTTVTTTCTKVIPVPTPTSSTTSTITSTVMMTPSTTVTSTSTVTVCSKVIQTIMATATITSTTTEVITPATVQTVYAACATANFANMQVSTGKYIDSLYGVGSLDNSFEYTNPVDCCNWGFRTHGDELGVWLFTPNLCRLFSNPRGTACTSGQAGTRAQAGANSATTTGAYVLGNGNCGAVVRIFEPESSS